MQNTFSQSGNDFKWFSKKSFFRIGIWHSRPPRDPPFHGKCHLKFPFWFFEPLPYSFTYLVSKNLSYKSFFLLKTSFEYLSDDCIAIYFHSAFIFSYSCCECIWRFCPYLTTNSKVWQIKLWMFLIHLKLWQL